MLLLLLFTIPVNYKGIIAILYIRRLQFGGVSEINPFTEQNGSPYAQNKKIRWRNYTSKSSFPARCWQSL